MAIESPQYALETTTGTVTTRRRADTAYLFNPLVGIPSVQFLEQEVTTLPDGTTFIKPTETLGYTADDPAALIPLVDPVTLAPTGKTFPAGQFELMAVSLYLWLARKRDTASV